MNNLETTPNASFTDSRRADERGSAMVIAIFVLALISIFVALALSRAASEAAAVGNETAEGRTFYAAQGSLEMMTRNFNKVFEVRLNPTTADLNAVRNGSEPGLTGYTFTRELDKTLDGGAVVLSGGEYSGLYAFRDNWRLRTTATNNVGVQVQLTRNILNNRIPIFQFGIFNDDDLELYRPPRFSFGGRVHTNGSFFVSPGADGIYFDSRVTAVRQIVTQSWRNWNTGDSGNDQTWIKNASGEYKQLLPSKGSVFNTSEGASDNIFVNTGNPSIQPNPDLPPSKLNANWKNDRAVFDGNLVTDVKPLKLPISLGTESDLFEMVQRGKRQPTSGSPGDLMNDNGTLAPVSAAKADDAILTTERFANKPGIRVSLSDSKAKLPGCASGVGTAAVATQCGIRLDGDVTGLNAPLLAYVAGTTSAADLPKTTRGYQPRAMIGGGSYQATRINGERLYNAGQEVWIKIETVQINAQTQAVETKDITEDILSLGATQQAPQAFAVDDYDETPPDNSQLTSTSAQSASNGTDSRSIIKIQRFAINGKSDQTIPGESNPNGIAAAAATDTRGATRYLYRYLPSGTQTAYYLSARFTGKKKDIEDRCVVLGSSGCTSAVDDPNSSLEKLGHLKVADLGLGGSTKAGIVPFPIELFDTREGTFYDQADIYRDQRVTQNGVMSMIDIDIANLRRFLRGDFNSRFPTNTLFAVGNGGTGLRNTDIPQNAGWVLSISDRRGDADFDGEYDMEDIYGYGYNSATSRYYGSDGVMQAGEDVNKNGTLEADFGNEAPNKYDDDKYADYAAVDDHKFYRRGVRLINGAVLPGIYDSATVANTRGLTVASENGLYIQGNYNATGIASAPGTGNTPFSNFLPATNSALDIPASIVSDSVTALSNSWNDAQSFASPYEQSGRKAAETTMRFAMISGDTIPSKSAAPHQGGISPRMSGGVHNFKRYLERWTDPADSNFSVRLNYSGSLINLFNSRNNNGAFKCCDTVYNPPVRNWVFDGTFLDPGRLPPGTPFFQYIQITGFERTND